MGIIKIIYSSLSSSSSKGYTGSPRRDADERDGRARVKIKMKKIMTFPLRRYITAPYTYIYVVHHSLGQRE